MLMTMQLKLMSRLKLTTYLFIQLNMSRLGCSMTELFTIIRLEDGGRTKYAKDLDEFYCHGSVCPGGQRAQLAKFDAMVLVV